MKLPDFSFEKKLWKSQYNCICGIDEVGRGCFAGPVFAGAVVFEKNYVEVLPIKINDSKKLTAIQREKAYEWIRKNAKYYGVGMASVSQINKFGIKKATEVAFRKAIKKCKEVDYLLIDAFYIPNVKGLRRKNQLAIKKGDSLSLSIAAASIMAKVERDDYMKRVSKNKEYSKYGWDENKGYGTKTHQLAIMKYGITKLHRTKFVETFLKRD